MKPITEVTPGRKVKFEVDGKWHVGEVQLYDGEPIVVDSYTDAVQVKLEPSGYLVGVFRHILQDREMRKEGE